MKTGKLYLVATPIGNLKDITIRAKKVLSRVDIVLAEDTRKSKVLLTGSKSQDKPTKWVAYYEQNEMRQIPEIVKWLKQGKEIALVSNAGTPLVSDPGYKLVQELIRQKIKIIAIPGASSVMTALVVSGFPPTRFAFLGFLPKKTGRQKKVLENFVGNSHGCSLQTLIFFESPNRLLKTLKNIKEVLGNLEVAVCFELTKKFENVVRGKVSEVLKKLTNKKIKGEVTLVVKL